MTVVAVAEQPKIGRPLLFSTPDELQQAIDAYWEDCHQRQVPYTMSGLAYALGINRNTLLNYEGREPFVGTVKRARERVERQLEEGLLTRERQVAGHIFNLKNNFGWKDTQEVEHTHTLLAIGLPGSVPAQLEPPVIDVSPLPVLPPGESAPEHSVNSATSHNAPFVNQAKSLIPKAKRPKKAGKA